MSFFLSIFSQMKLDSEGRYIRVLILASEEEVGPKIGDLLLNKEWYYGRDPEVLFT